MKNYCKFEVIYENNYSERHIDFHSLVFLGFIGVRANYVIDGRDDILALTLGHQAEAHLDEEAEPEDVQELHHTQEDQLKLDNRLEVGVWLWVYQVSIDVEDVHW